MASVGVRTDADSPANGPLRLRVVNGGADAHDLERNQRSHRAWWCSRHPQAAPGEEIAGEWDNWRSIDETAMNEDCADFMDSAPKGVIKPKYTNPLWIALTHDGGGNHAGLDFDPDANRRPGQVIVFGRYRHQAPRCAGFRDIPRHL